MPGIFFARYPQKVIPAQGRWQVGDARPGLKKTGA